MFDNRKHTKVKNSKIQTWRIELAEFSYDIKYRLGVDNVAPDSFTCAYCLSMSTSNLTEVHNGLCHPGVTRLLHFVRTKNLPFSTEDVKKTCSDFCRVETAILPSTKWQINQSDTHPMERLSIDFKGPLPSATRNRYLLTVVDEYSRFPFAIPCPDIN